MTGSKRISIFLFLVAELFLFSAFGRDEVWFEKQMAKLDAIEQLSREEQLDELKVYVQALNGDSELTNFQTEVFERARQMTLKHDGFAEYYAGRIREGLKLGLEWREKHVTGYYYDYMNYRNHAFGAMSRFPSLSTVNVAISFLGDEHVWPDPDTGGYVDMGNARSAGWVLQEIIADPPTDHSFDLDAWRAWRDEIKAGKSTFRLKGDQTNTRYNFSGPVRPQQPRPSKLPVGKGGKGSVAEDPVTDNPGMTSKVFWIALAILGAAVLIYFGSRRWTLP